MKLVGVGGFNIHKLFWHFREDVEVCNDGGSTGIIPEKHMSVVCLLDESSPIAKGFCHAQVVHD